MIPKLSKRLQFSSATDGNVTMLFAFALVPVTIIAGGALDLSNAMSTRSRNQTAADAAVLAANALPQTATNSQRVTVATNVYNANNGTGTPQVNATADNVTISNTSTVPTTLLKLARINSITVDVNAKANAKTTTSTATSGKVCLLALDPASTDGIHIQGTNYVDYSGCWGYTNAATATAINANGSQAAAIGAGHCAVGSYDVPANNFSPAPKSACNVMADPFATVGAYETNPYVSKFPTPTLPTTCTATNLKLKKGTYTLNPGRYCGGIDIAAQATVSFTAGVYYVDAGAFVVQSGASVSGSNVLLYLNGSGATMTVIGGGTINLKGRSSDDANYGGFLVIQNPSAARGATSNIQGGGTFNMEGMVYMPTQRIEVSGNGNVNGTSRMFGMVAKDFYFRGNGTFRMTTATGSQTPKDIVPNLPPDVQRNVSLAK